MYRFQPKKYKASRVISENKKIASVVLKSSDFLFSQASIVSSVMLEPNSYLINPRTAKFVNNNGDTWSNESLKANYSSFIGAFNYVNHVQVPEKSVGFLPDAVIRRISIDKKSNSFIYYADILVATHKDHTALIKKILSNQVEFLSMGCDADISQCSKCGEKFDTDMLCDDLTYHKGKYFMDHKGQRRRIAEILGTKEPGTVSFIEASWLTEVPAFAGAAKRHSLMIPKDADIEISIPSNVLDRQAIQRYVKT